MSSTKTSKMPKTRLWKNRMPVITLYIPQRTYSGNTADLFGTTDLFGQYTGSIRAEYKQTHLAGKLHTRYRIISQQGDTKRQNLHQQSNVKII